MLKIIIGILVLFFLAGCASTKSKVIIGDDYNYLSGQKSGNDTFIIFPYLYLHFDYQKKLTLINELLKKPNDFLNIFKHSEFHDYSFADWFARSWNRNSTIDDLTKYHNFCFQKSDLNNIMIFIDDTETISIFHKMGFWEKKFHGGISFWFVHEKGKWFLTEIGLSNTEEFENEECR